MTDPRANGEPVKDSPNGTGPAVGPLQPPIALEPGAVLSVQALIQHLRFLEATEDWEGLHREGYRRCAVFDADGTLWKGDLTGKLVEMALAQGRVTSNALKALDALLIRYGEPPAGTVGEALEHIGKTFNSGHLFEVGQMHGMDRTQVTLDIWTSWNLVFTDWEVTAVEESARTIMEEGFRGNIFEGIRPLLDYLRTAGYQTFVVSAGIEPAIQVGASYLGFEASQVRGARSRVAGNRLTSVQEPPVMYADGKRAVAEQLCDGLPIIAFGDSVVDSDRMMVDHAYVSVAVEPAGSHLSYARKQKHFILDFSKTEDGHPADSFHRP